MDPTVERFCGGLGFWVTHYDVAANMTTYCKAEGYEFSDCVLMLRFTKYHIMLCASQEKTFPVS